MRKSIVFSLFVSALFVLTACSGKMGALSADNFTVTPNPLESRGGQIPVTISGMFPEKYMQRKAVVTITPELRAASAKQQGQPYAFQGEKVQGNDHTISYRLGGRYTMKADFAYQPEYLNSDLYLTFNARIGKKMVKIPEVKIAHGTIATSELYRLTMFSNGGCLAPDSFQHSRQMRQEANIKFLVNEANLRKSELQNNSVQEFVRLLKQINAEREQLNIKNVEIQAYASPDGGFEFNDRLANRRQDVSEGYVKEQLKQTGVQADIYARYTAQDWEGFQQLVQASNIQDKDVILRVLSMYKDPAEREQQIRNMSEGFQELATGILPELRRSRLIINYETVGRTDDEIERTFSTEPGRLTADELLYLAASKTDAAERKAIYEKTAQLYPADYRPINNLATLALAQGQEKTAQNYIRQALRINPNAAEPLANLGLLQLKGGNLQEAEGNIAKATRTGDVSEAMGILSIAKGNYAQAIREMSGIASNNTALAQLLNKEYGNAALTLEKIANPDALTDYLRAVLAARRGNQYAVSANLKDAIKKDPSLAAYAENDLEFSNLK